MAIVKRYRKARLLVAAASASAFVMVMTALIGGANNDTSDSASDPQVLVEVLGTEEVTATSSPMAAARATEEPAATGEATAAATPEPTVAPTPEPTQAVTQPQARTRGS